jgi:hypothetical protein
MTVKVYVIVLPFEGGIAVRGLFCKQKINLKN